MGVTSNIRKILFRIFQIVYAKILAIVCGESPQGVAPIKNSILMESASSLACKIRFQKLTSVEVVQSYIDRIQEINETLNCVVDDHFDEALKEAAKADDVISSGTKTKEELENERPLLGVPFTTEQSRQGYSFARMQEAGAIHIASTNVSEARYGRETNNRKYGRTANPYDINRTAGGPSGGEACVVAACGSPLGIASFARVPSAFNGVFCHSNRELCWLSRSSADLLPALKFLTQKSDIVQADVKSLKYYYTDSDECDLATPVEEEIKEAILRAVNYFKNTHRVTVQKMQDHKLREAYRLWRSSTLSRHPEESKEGKASRKELVRAIFGKSQQTLITLLTETLESGIESDSTPNAKESLSKLQKEFQVCEQSATKTPEQMNRELLGTNGVFICPTQPGAAFRHNESLGKLFDVGYAGIFDAMGLPATHCPTGLDSRGLPIGFQVVAGPGQDHLSIAVACEMDKAFGGWKPPLSHGIFTLKNTIFHSISKEKVKVL